MFLLHPHVSRKEIGEHLKAFLAESADNKLLNDSFNVGSLDALSSLFPDIPSLKHLRGERAALFDYFEANRINEDIHLNKPL